MQYSLIHIAELMRVTQKFIFALIVFITSALFISVSPVLAAANTAHVFVFDSQGNPEDQATVSVTCNSITQAASHVAFGEYSATFADGVCKPYRTITATASNPEGETGAGSGTMLETEGYINFNLVSNISVPEFGLLPGLLAVGGSAIAYLKLRKNR